MAERLESAGCQLVGVESNLVDVVWAADPNSPQPARWSSILMQPDTVNFFFRPEEPIFPLELQFTGRSWQSKVEEIRGVMKEKGCEALVLRLDGIPVLVLPIDDPQRFG